MHVHHAWARVSLQALLLGGASPRAANLHNQSALRVARRFSLPRMEALLARHGTAPLTGTDADADADADADDIAYPAHRAPQSERAASSLDRLSVTLGSGDGGGGEGVLPPAAARRAARVWAAQGTVVFPRLLGAAAVAPLVAHARALFHEHASGPDLSLTIRQSKQRALRPLAIARGGDALRLIASRLEPFLAEALGPSVAILECGVMRTSPGAQDQSFHADVIHFDAQLASVQISLVDTAATQGALEVVPASHGGGGGGGRDGDAGGVPIAVPAGTVTFYSPHLRHRGRGNSHRDERLFLGLTLLARGGVVPSGIPYAVEQSDVGRWWLEGGEVRQVETAAADRSEAAALPEAQVEAQAEAQAQAQAEAQTVMPSEAQSEVQAGAAGEAGTEAAGETEPGEAGTCQADADPSRAPRAARLAGRALQLHLQVEALREQQQSQQQGQSQAAAQAVTAAAQRLQHRKERVQQEAITAFTAALALDTSQADVWFQLSTSLFLAGETAEAHHVSARGARHHPADERLGGVFEAAFPPHGDSPPAPAPTAAAAPATAGSSAGFTSVETHWRSVQMPAGASCVEPLTRDAHAYAHFGATPQVYTSRAPLLRPEECAAAIRAAEGWAATTGGWSTSRHFEVPTTDVPLRHLTSLLPSLNRALRDVLLPAAAAAYYPAATASAVRLRVLDGFLVRYQAGKQAGLPTHCDQSLLSYTIALNEPTEYEGGGTFFRALGAALDAPHAGHAVLFPGRLEHAGQPITRGTRYVIVLFMGFEDNGSGRAEGWVLRGLEERRQSVCQVP